MFRKLLIFVVALLFAGAPNVLASVGVFDFTAEIGNPAGTADVRQVGDRYLILASGADIWGNADQFTYAYKQVSGNIRFELAPAWDLGGRNEWGKIEAMLRVNTDAGSIHYSSASRRGEGTANQDPYNAVVDDYAGSQWRATAGGASSGVDWWGRIPQKLAQQRVVSNDYQLVQTLADFGGGWENVKTQLVPGLPDELLLGAAVTSHDNRWLVQANIGSVAYTENPDLVGVVRAGDPLAEACGDTLGFLVTAAKMPDGWSYWNEGDGERPSAYRQAEYLAKNSGMTGYPPVGPGDFPSLEFGTEYRRFVNLADAGEGRAFNAGNGFPDFCFPGVDNWVYPDADPDGDDQFGVVVEACIELTEGLHVVGGAFDDGVLLRIGGVEIGRTNDWNETSVWLFEAPVAGIYSLEAVGYEIGGGAFMELYEYLPNGTMILLGDVANGGSPVYVPEPATIALLGFGGLSMLRIRKKR